MKAIIFNRWVEPPDELISFCESLGYEKHTFMDLSNNFDNTALANPML
jgi:hypothetical protein